MKDTLSTMVLLVGALGLLGVIGPALDIEDRGYEHEVAHEEMRKQDAQARFERAAQEVCGPNAAYRLTDTAGQILCTSKKGRKTKEATL